VITHVSFKIVVDETRCELHGECVLAAPEIFQIADDDDELVTVLLAEPSEDLREQAQNAVDDCPMQALRIIG
jgi:ferredoxin